MGKAAVDSSKSSSLWSILNSPFCLWLLTAGLVTLLSGYVSASRQCVGDSEKIIESLSKVDAEIANRQSFILHAARSEKSLSEFKTALNSIPRLYVEFSARSLFDLLGLRVQLVQKVELGSDVLATRLEKEWAILQPGLAQEDFATVYAQVLSSANLEQLAEETYSQIREQILHYSNDTIWYNFNLLVPSCGPSDLVHSIFTDRVKIARFPPGDYYDTFTPDSRPEVSKPISTN